MSPAFCTVSMVTHVLSCACPGGFVCVPLGLLVAPPCVCMCNPCYRRLVHITLLSVCMGTTFDMASENSNVQNVNFPAF